MGKFLIIELVPRCGPPHFNDSSMMRAFSFDMKTLTACSRFVLFMSPWYLYFQKSVVANQGIESLHT